MNPLLSSVIIINLVFSLESLHFDLKLNHKWEFRFVKRRVWLFLFSEKKNICGLKTYTLTHTYWYYSMHSVQRRKNLIIYIFYDFELKGMNASCELKEASAFYVRSTHFSQKDVVFTIDHKSSDMRKMTTLKISLYTKLLFLFFRKEKYM